MFVIKVNTCDKKQTFFRVATTVDSLEEAESVAVEVVRKHFRNNKLILVYDDDLEYTIFEVGKPLGMVAILSR